MPIIIGTDADDQFGGGDFDDTLRGLDGEDTIAGNSGDDEIYGNEGNDFLLGNLGDDLVLSGLGRDVLYGGQGNDALFGGNGRDTLSGDRGADFLSGGRGDDVFVFFAATSDAVDTINRFEQGDTLGLSGFDDGSLRVVQDGADVEIYAVADGVEQLLARALNSDAAVVAAAADYSPTPF